MTQIWESSSKQRPPTCRSRPLRSTVGLVAPAMEHCLRPQAGRLRGGGDGDRGDFPALPALQPQGMDSKRFFSQTRHGGVPTGFTSYEACMPSATFGGTAPAQTHAHAGLSLSPGAAPAHEAQPSGAGAPAWSPHPSFASSPRPAAPMSQFIGYHQPMQHPLAAQRMMAPMAAPMAAPNFTTSSHASGVYAAGAGGPPPAVAAAFAVPLPMPCTGRQPAVA